MLRSSFKFWTSQLSLSRCCLSVLYYSLYISCKADKKEDEHSFLVSSLLSAPLLPSYIIYLFFLSILMKQNKQEKKRIWHQEKICTFRFTQESNKPLASDFLNQSFSGQWVVRNWDICWSGRMDVDKLKAFTSWQWVDPCWECIWITKLCESPDWTIKLGYWKIERLEILGWFVSHDCWVSIISSSIRNPRAGHFLLNGNWAWPWSWKREVHHLDFDLNMSFWCLIE